MKNKTGVYNYSFKSKIFMIFIVVIIIMKGNQAHAQDLIILKTGDEIKAKVNEIGPDLIKYKKFENLSGPDYSVQKNTVSMIKYENGTKDVFSEQTTTKPQTTQSTLQKNSEQDAVNSSPKKLVRRGSRVSQDGKNLSSAELRAVLTPYPEVLKSYDSGKTLSFVGDCFAYTVIADLLITAIRAKDLKAGTPEYRSIYTTGVVIAIPLCAVGITLSIIGNSKIRSSLNLYNSRITKPVTYKINFGIQESGGVGFALKF